MDLKKMKKIFFIITVFIVSCKPKPQFYIDGKPYYTEKRCIKEELAYQFYGPKFKMECVEWKIDTIEWKK